MISASQLNSLLLLRHATTDLVELCRRMDDYANEEPGVAPVLDHEFLAAVAGAEQALAMSLEAVPPSAVAWPE